MKLESLQLEKFNSNSLQKEQMFSLKGGLAAGTKTPPGDGCGMTNNQCSNFHYGYDVIRDGGTTYHDRTNVTYCP